MGELRIRNVNDDIIRSFKDRARRNRTTLQAVLHEALATECMRPRLEMADRLQRLRDGIRAVHGVLPDSTPGIRAERDGLE